MKDITKGGDGRKNAAPANPYPATTNHRITNSQVRQAIRAFEHYGHSNHSALRMLLPYIIEHCELNKIDYTLNCKAGVGYFIRKGNHK